MIWLGERYGYLSDWITQEWVRWTGQRISLAHDSWLGGPVGTTRRIGTDFFITFAREQGLHICQDDQRGGLISDFSALRGPHCDPSQVHPSVRHFYEQTAAYELDAWAHWSGIFRPFGGLLAHLFSRRLQQLNVPLSGLDTSQGLTSEIIRLVDARSGAIQYTAWIRELVGTGNTLYAGSYSLCSVPGYDGPCVKVVFPLPNGNAMVIMKPLVHPDGSLSVISEGERFSEPGFYFTIRRPKGRIYARYVRALREQIHVYPAQNGSVRGNHVLTLWNIPFLRLHYRLRVKENPTPA